MVLVAAGWLVGWLVELPLWPCILSYSSCSSCGSRAKDMEEELRAYGAVGCPERHRNWND